MQSQCSKTKLQKCSAACKLGEIHHARLAIVGINYKTSTLREREPLQLAIEELPQVDDLLVSTAGVMEAAAIGPAEEIVEAKVEQFVYWYEAVRREPIYNGLGKQFEDIRAEELAAVVDGCPSECREIINKFSVRLVRRLLQSACRRSE